MYICDSWVNILWLNRYSLTGETILETSLAKNKIAFVTAAVPTFTLFLVWDTDAKYHLHTKHQEVCAEQAVSAKFSVPRLALMDDAVFKDMAAIHWEYWQRPTLSVVPLDLRSKLHGLVVKWQWNSGEDSKAEKTRDDLKSHMPQTANTAAHSTPCLQSDWHGEPGEMGRVTP